MQEIILIQRNWNTVVDGGIVPEKLRDFECRLNKFSNDNWRLHSVVPTTIKDASLPLFVLVRDI